MTCEKEGNKTLQNFQLSLSILMVTGILKGHNFFWCTKDFFCHVSGKYRKFISPHNICTVIFIQGGYFLVFAPCMLYLRGIYINPLFDIPWEFPGGLDSKASVYNVGDLGLIPGSGRSPGEGNPLQYSCLENPMDREAWQATVHKVRKSQTQLNNFTFTLLVYNHSY